MNQKGRRYRFLSLITAAYYHLAAFLWQVGEGLSCEAAREMNQGKKQLSEPHVFITRDNTLRTVAAYHLPPRAVGIPRALSALAKSLKVEAPAF